MPGRAIVGSRGERRHRDGLVRSFLVLLPLRTIFHAVFLQGDVEFRAIVRGKKRTDKRERWSVSSRCAVFCLAIDGTLFTQSSRKREKRMAMIDQQSSALKKCPIETKKKRILFFYRDNNHRADDSLCSLSRPLKLEQHSLNRCRGPV